MTPDGSPSTDRAVSPSPMLEIFVRNAARLLPASEHAALGRRAAAIAGTTSEADGRRARRCAEWAMEVAARTDPSHPGWARVHELHRQWRALWFGVRMGTSGPRGPMPIVGEDVRIQWVDEAVEVARRIGEEEGWEHAPWEALLDELIAMEGTGP